MNSYVSILLALGKVRITSFVALTTGLGYILANGSADLFIVIPIIGVFILSAGSSALNQVQEHRYDAIMDRTKNRPIPKGIISFRQGVAVSILMIVTGLLILALGVNINAFLFGILALFWYNLFYTPLKRVSALAVVPGAVIGAIPPIIGWVSGNGEILNPQIWALALFFFIWQIPHFWLLVLIFDKDYQKAGYPTLTQKFSGIQLSRVTYTWIVALVASCMLIPLFGLSQNIITDILLFIAGCWLIWRTKNLLNYLDNRNKNIRFAFLNINVYVLAVAFLLTMEKIFSF